MKDIKIRDVKVIMTEPDNIRLVIVKIETTEPELYGLLRHLTTSFLLRSLIFLNVPSYIETVQSPAKQGLLT